jgi:uncharacterized membrane protein
VKVSRSIHASLQLPNAIPVPGTDLDVSRLAGIWHQIRPRRLVELAERAGRGDLAFCPALVDVRAPLNKFIKVTIKALATFVAIPLGVTLYMAVFAGTLVELRCGLAPLNSRVIYVL